MRREIMDSYNREYLPYIEAIERYLIQVRTGHATSPILALWNLRLLQDKLRHAEYELLANVCEEIDGRILNLSNDTRGKERAAGLMDLVALLRQGPAYVAQQRQSAFVAMVHARLALSAAASA